MLHGSLIDMTGVAVGVGVGEFVGVGVGVGVCGAQSATVPIGTYGHWGGTLLAIRKSSSCPA